MEPTQASIWLGIVMLVIMGALMMPRFIEMNRGRIVRNGILWASIVAGLVLFYYAFGPFGSAADNLPVNSRAAEEDPAINERPRLGEESSNRNFTPPQE